MNVKITFAELKDEKYIEQLLSEADLPYNDFANHINDFLLASMDDILIGVIGIEILGEFGLLRSLAISHSKRNQGIGKLLCEKMIAYASLQGIKKLFLLTMTAESFFENLGFKKVVRENVAEEIKNTEEFKNVCPVSAVCMVYKISGKVHYYPKDILKLQEDVKGAKMWAVSLDKTMLTYFEVSPNCSFENHSHESEQITFVLDGELFFDIKGKVHSVKEGETISIPSNVPHSVFTTNESVKAVDAWSPVMSKYKNK